jgi:retron-type reverse transcriptase
MPVERVWRRAMEKRAVNWIVDAGIKGFFDSIGHDWMMRFA